MSSFSWLHLSDWHEGKPDIDRKIVRDELLKDIAASSTIDQRIANPDFIIFSGDIAHSGTDTEYKSFERDFLVPLKAIVKDTPIYLVPGNHDINLRSLRTFPGIPNDADLARRRWEEIASDKDHAHYCLSPFKSFIDFRNRHHTASVVEDPDCPFGAVARFSKSNGTKSLNIGIMLLNSAWLCGRIKHKGRVHDYGYLRLTESQLLPLIKKIKDCDLSIAVLHHPIYWLDENDQARTERLLAKNCHLVLHGHEHRPRVNVVDSDVGSVIYIPAGAAYNRRLQTDPRYNNSYNFTHIDLESGRGYVFLRRWDDDAPNRWVEDHRHWPGGVAQFAIPERDERRAGLTRRWYTRISENYRPFFDNRPAKRMKLTVTQEPCAVPGAALRTTLRWDLDFEDGPPDVYEPEVGLSEYLREQFDDVALNKHFASGNKLVVGSAEQSLPAWMKGTLRFQCNIPEKNGKVRVQYSFPSGERDWWLFALTRFAREVEFVVRQAKGFRYEYDSIGGFPAPEPVTDELTETVVTSSTGECLPEQGILMNWWRPQEEVVRNCGAAPSA